MKVAVVTRECGGDRRYGMGRSWASVATVLESRGHELRRIDGDALDEIAQAEARRMGVQAVPLRRPVGERAGAGEVGLARRPVARGEGRAAAPPFADHRVPVAVALVADALFRPSGSGKRAAP